MTVDDRTRRGSRPIDRIPVGALIVVGALALIVFGWTALFKLVEREKAEAVESTAMVNASLTHAVGEHIRAAFTVIDMDSFRLATEIESLGIVPEAVRAHMRRMDNALPFVRQISVIGAGGMLAASIPEFEPVLLADSETYRFHRDNGSLALFIAKPVRYRSSGDWNIPVSRRLFSAEGTFAGTLSYGLSPEYFSNYFLATSLGETDSLTVVRDDGAVLVHRVGNRFEYGESAPSLPWFSSARSTGAGWSVAQNRDTGVRRVMAYETMPDYPLVLALGTPLEAALAPVQRRLPTYYSVAGAASALLLLAALLIARLFQRQARANRQLAESEDRFRSLAALSSDWYWEQDADARITVRSDDEAMKSEARLRPELGATRWDEPALNLSEADWAAHRAALDRREPFRNFEIERRSEKGGTAWVSVSGEPVFGPDGAFRGYRGVGHNITERKRAERLLAFEHAIASTLAANESTESIMRTVIRATCEIQGWNCGRYFALDEEAGVLRCADGWVRADSGLDEFLAASRDLTYARGEGVIGRAWQSGEPVWERDLVDGGIVKYRAMTDRFHTRSAFAFPAIADGEPAGIFAFASTDARERDERLIQAAGAIGSLVGLFLQRRRAEHEIRRLNAELEQRVAERTAELQRAVKELEAFSYSVAHDLRSPLRAMNGYCEIILQDYAAAIPEQGRAYLGRVAANASRLGMLIDDLLAFSRCSRVALQPGPVNIEALFREAIAEHVPADSPARVCVDALPACRGDASLLRLVIANLVSNAVKYSGNVAVPAIDIGHADGAYFVRDNGAGFDMQYADKLFGVFNRLHRIEEFEGTGVGLAIVKRVVERHGGRVWAQAAPERGATFFFTLG